MTNLNLKPNFTIRYLETPIPVQNTSISMEWDKDLVMREHIDIY